MEGDVKTITEDGKTLKLVTCCCNHLSSFAVGKKT